MIHILTLKVGDKYSSQYINNLYRGIKKNTTVDFKMYCYTEDPKDIVDDVEIIELANPNLLKLQWHKIQFHSKNFAGIKNGERCLILDIDWIITGNLDDILSFDIKPKHFGCFERWWSNRLEWCSINGGFQMYRMGDTEYLHRIFFADEDFSGGASAYMVQNILEKQNGYYFLDSKPITIHSKDHRPAYSTDGDYFSKPNCEDIFDVIYNVFNELDPKAYPQL